MSNFAEKEIKWAGAGEGGSRRAGIQLPCLHERCGQAKGAYFQLSYLLMCVGFPFLNNLWSYFLRSLHKGCNPQAKWMSHLQKKTDDEKHSQSVPSDYGLSWTHVASLCTTISLCIIINVGRWFMSSVCACVRERVSADGFCSISHSTMFLLHLGS